MKRWSLFLLTSLIAGAQGVVLLPKVTGPIPNTADSKPFGAAITNAEPLDLSKYGYVEEEFILTGTANVYDWPTPDTLTVKAANAPYGTRVLIRRPAQAARFSGTAVVELANVARKFDWPMMWGFTHDYILEHGDAWVQISSPTSVEGLKKFNPKRYADLSFPAPVGCAGDIEEGLRWDVISQIAAALKNNGSLTGGMPVQRAFMTTQITDIITYINAIHSHVKLPGGKPVFDGYMVRNPAGPAPINHCAQAAGGADRRVLKDLDVPMIGVVAQGEVVGMLASRKADNDRYRLWEVAASSHIDKFAYTGIASLKEQTEAVGAAGAQGTAQWPFSARCEPEIVLQDMPLLTYAFHGALAALDRWVKDGVAPTRAPRLDVVGNTMKLNEFGIASGGIRSPYSDVPTATYTTASNGGGSCRELGTTTPLSWVRLEQLYGNQKAYAQKVAPIIDKMVQDGYVTASDAQRMRTELGVTK